MKRLLYFAPGARSDTGCIERLQAASLPLTGGSGIRHSGVELEPVIETEQERVLDRLSREFVHVLLLDLRDDDVSAGDRARHGFELLEQLDRAGDIELRYGFHRILALVRGDDDATDRVVAELGARGVGRVLRQSAAEEQFEKRVLDAVVGLLGSRGGGKTALAASGGGITGIFFEIGAVKCLGDCLSFGSGSFDLYYGISAGAVVSGVLAGGYSIEELMAAIAKRPGGRIPPLDLQLFRLSHLNFPDMMRRLGSATDVFWHTVYDMVWHHALPSFNDLVLDYTALVGPPFRSDHFERLLGVMFERPGATNDFRRLPRPLYIGASDQDARRHVLFGSEGHDHVPISVAIQGSLAVNPAFASVPIESRYYEDGAVTRTSNFTDAIARGADPIFIVDPFVPYVSQVPGTADRRGVLYNVDQDIRSLSYTRFETTRDWVLRKHPEVSTCTILPSNRVRRLLTLNPMDHRPFLAIWRGAYLSTFERLKRVRHRLEGDLAAHGASLDFRRAEAVAERLERLLQPSFCDFFPDGRVEIPTPPLALEQADANRAAASVPLATARGSTGEGREERAREVALAAVR